MARPSLTKFAMRRVFQAVGTRRAILGLASCQPLTHVLSCRLSLPEIQAATLVN